jgi:serine/alanine adding enzyme
MTRLAEWFVFVKFEPDDADAIQIHSPASFRAAGLVPPDVYFAPGYGRAEEANGAGDWFSLVAYDGLWQLPLHLRSSSDGTDAVSPYGYSGVYASSRLTAADRRSAWSRARSELRARGVLSVFLRQSPLIPHPFDTAPGEVVVSSHSTVMVATINEDSAWRAMEGRSRTSIRKADRSGFSSVVRPAAPEDLVSGGAFRNLYEGAMRRRTAAERYFFNDAYYAALRDALGSDLLIGITTDSGGRAVAAALFMRHADLLHYHLAGSEPEAGRVGATNQLIWRAIEWASEHGVTGCHLGGGVSNYDSLFKFKRSFGGEVLSFDAFGVVVDDAAYRVAVESRAAKLNMSVSALLEINYFPRFRIPA